MACREDARPVKKALNLPTGLAASALGALGLVPKRNTRPQPLKSPAPAPAPASNAPQPTADADGDQAAQEGKADADMHDLEAGADADGELELEPGSQEASPAASGGGRAACSPKTRPPSAGYAGNSVGRGFASQVMRQLLTADGPRSAAVKGMPSRRVSSRLASGSLTIPAAVGDANCTATAGASGEKQEGLSADDLAHTGHSGGHVQEDAKAALAAGARRVATQPFAVGSGSKQPIVWVGNRLAARKHSLVSAACTDQAVPDAALPAAGEPREHAGGANTPAGQDRNDQPRQPHSHADAEEKAPARSCAVHAGQASDVAAAEAPLAHKTLQREMPAAPSADPDSAQKLPQSSSAIPGGMSLRLASRLGQSSASQTTAELPVTDTGAPEAHAAKRHGRKAKGLFGAALASLHA